MVAIAKGKSLNFKGGNFLRHRLVLATLSSRPVVFDSIREDDAQFPGLSQSEISFLRLLDKITSGTVIKINATGTSLSYTPGFLIGGNRIVHDCHVSRPICYYLEPLLMLCPFAKRSIDITLRGATHSATDVCIDTIASVSVPLLRRLAVGIPLLPQLDIKKRSLSHGEASGNSNGGVVQFRCDVLNSKIKPIEIIDPGFVKRIRGIAFANKTSPAHITRMVDVARRIFNRFTPDVYIHTDHNNHEACGIGFGIQFVAETTEGCLVGSDWSNSNRHTTPEQVSENACRMLLEEVNNGGCIDSNNGCMALLYCALADSDLNRVRLGRLSDATIQFMRDLRSFFGVQFKVRVFGNAVADASDSENSEAYEDDVVRSRGDGVLVSCIGHTLLRRHHRRQLSTAKTRRAP
ncbi:RNA 3'-terminal phosphate cyclase [Gracilaria domingensis]|nr:RNA 3'-terminal phosphate cyclase [Gracilaria domingensis]